MSKKEKVIDQLMQLSSWALEKAFAIEDNEDAGMAELEAELDWLDDLAGELDEAVFVHSGSPKCRRIVHDAPAQVQ
ncbi:hypothetical protein [Acidithiobacillus ferrooxidans]|uniref:Uncharacterized protein n=1 Tax=Acidithiobacillus ferrooxidans TaxID=920 RepID=A0A2W1KJ54_ACIFR|nr:hypothetical protein [Acidithiobacillus ferrooxidans]MBU2818953.1 hypothetical protein [Acidithiobacillus ferrooxidans]MCR1342806.1 hypothetical protein [Acidithiobacillus ferrooxidans]PZD81794.1 hypothetical protein DN052_01585 [Acidithiobacillus ferrooxidans]QLK41908.1 hypothetical protein FE661_06880 [Acidithiobacillus ferrooxidans]QZT53873.1 hypothetical protein K7B00_06875 [Acidithiobacillus ferrooxidans]